jgi:hypothetical protein
MLYSPYAGEMMRLWQAEIAFKRISFKVIAYTMLYFRLREFYGEKTPTCTQGDKVHATNYKSYS